MKLSALVTALVGAGVVYGAALTEKRRERNAARLAARKSNFPLPATSKEGLKIQEWEYSNETAHIQYSSNWAGAVLIGTGYKSVTGTFVVPTPKAPSGGSSSTQVSLKTWLYSRPVLCACSCIPAAELLGMLPTPPKEREKDVESVIVRCLSLGRHRR